MQGTERNQGLLSYSLVRGSSRRILILLRLVGVNVVRKVALDLVGHHLLDCLLDAMHDHFKSCPYQRLCFLNFLCYHHIAKPCRSVERSSI